MKKLLAVILLLCMLMPCAVAEEPGHFLVELLDQMDLEQLEYVQSEVEKKIIERRSEAAQDPNNTGIWEQKYYVDDFGEPTDSAYLTNNESIFGSFSNGVTSNSELRVQVLIDECVSFKLYEYYTSLVTNAYSSYAEDYNVTIKADNGDIKEYTAFIPAHGDRVMINLRYGSTELIEYMKTPQKLKILLKNKNNPANKYLFDIDTTGLSNLYHSAFGE